MNVEIGTEAAQFPDKEYINGIFLAVQYENTDFFIPHSPYTYMKKKVFISKKEK
jgi:hypothetical protein